jgi:hypothetical protein
LLHEQYKSSTRAKKRRRMDVCKKQDQPKKARVVSTGKQDAQPIAMEVASADCKYSVV